MDENRKTCPCCGKPVTVKTLNTPYKGRGGRELLGVHECPNCGAIFGRCYAGEAIQIYVSAWHEGPEAPEDWQYIDLTLLASGGIRRFHGWIHRETRCILQTG